MSIKEKIASANGWQRLWLVTTVGCFVYFAWIVPIQQMDEMNVFRYKEKWAVEEEMKNPVCKDYMLKPFDQLEKSTDACYNIYVEREYAENNAQLTPESYKKKFREDQSSRLMTYIQTGLIVAVALSALLYAAGAVVAWVVSGFKKK